MIIKQHVLVLMVDDSWRMLLGAFRSLLLKGCGDFVVQQILKAYQSILQSCVALRIGAAMSAFLTSLCDFSVPVLSAVAGGQHHPGSPSGSL